MKKLKLIFKGQVQGVFFRDNIKKKAEELGIRGYVRNLSNGDVEAVFIGDNKLVDELLDYCKRGPGFAKVENVLVEEYEGGEFSDFEKKHY